MKKLATTIVICVLLCLASAIIFRVGETHRREFSACVACGVGRARDAGACACAESRQRIAEEEEAVPAPPPTTRPSPTKKKKKKKKTKGKTTAKGTPLESAIQAASKRMGCPKTLDASMLRELAAMDGFGMPRMFDTCVRARSGVEEAVRVCGRPSHACKLTSVTPSFESVRNRFEYTKQEGASLFGSMLESSDTFEEAKDNCDRAIECTGITYNAKRRRFESRTGHHPHQSKDNVSWIRTQFV